MIPRQFAWIWLTSVVHRVREEVVTIGADTESSHSVRVTCH